MCLGLWVSNPDFLGQSNVINTLRQISMLGIFAIGIAFVIITGGIDLSIGSVIGLTGVMIAKMSLGRDRWSRLLPLDRHPGRRSAPRSSSELVQGLLITRLKLQPFIVTLGGMLLSAAFRRPSCDGGTLSLGSSPLLRTRERRTACRSTAIRSSRIRSSSSWS